MSEKPHPAAINVAGVPYLRDARGSLVPIAAIKPTDLLMDEVVEDIIGSASAMSKAVADFKVNTFATVADFQALLLQNYGVTVGGAKGNITFSSFDGCKKVQVQVAERVQFGPELHAAKTLIDECLVEWSADSAEQMRALIDHVFQVNKEGHINAVEMFRLLRLNITDPRWLRAMEAIHDSIRPAGSREYVRFYVRPTGDAAWTSITIALASA